MRRLAILSLAVGALALGASSRTQAEPFTPARFTEPVSLAEPMIALGDLVQRLPASSQGKISVSTGLKDQVVTAYCREKPVGEMLHHLCRALDLTLEPRPGKDGGATEYILTRPARAATELERRRKRYHQIAAELAMAQLAMVDQAVLRAEGRPLAELQAEANRKRAEVQAMPVGLPRFRAEQELRALDQAMDPPTVAMVLAYRSLPALTREELWSGRRVVLRQRGGTLPLSAPVMEALSVAREYVARQSAPRDRAPIPPLPIPNDAITFQSSVGNNHRTGLHITAIRSENFRLAPDAAFPWVMMTSSFFFDLPKPHPEFSGSLEVGDAATAERLVRFDWPGRKLAKEDPFSYFRGTLPAAAFAELARQNPDLCVVGDAPIRPMDGKWFVGNEGDPSSVMLTPAAMVLARLRADKGRQGQPRLADLLTEVATLGRLRVRAEAGGWVECRSVLDCVDMAPRIAARPLTELLGPVVEKEGASPADVMRVAEGLTPAQCLALANEHLVLLPEYFPDPLIWNRFAEWRLLAALRPATFQRLVRSQPLAISNLNAAEVRAVERFVGEYSRRYDRRPLDLELERVGVRALQLHAFRTAERTSWQLQLRLPGVTEPLTDTHLGLPLTSSNVKQ